jgi:hypothetical protein
VSIAKWRLISHDFVLEINESLKSHRKEIVDFVEHKDTKGLKITGNIFDKLVNELTTELPFCPTVDKSHIVLSQSIITSLWCGWLSRAMANKKKPKFAAEYPEDFKKAISQAFEIG